MTLRGDKWDFLKLRCRLEKELGLQWADIGKGNIMFCRTYIDQVQSSRVPGFFKDKDDKNICAFLLHYINTQKWEPTLFKGHHTLQGKN